MLLRVFNGEKIPYSEPSRFLSEIDEQYLEFINSVVQTKTFNRSGLTSNILMKFRVSIGLFKRA